MLDGTIYFPVSMSVGDFDGDGGDDIAVLRVMLQYTEQFTFDNDVNLVGLSYSN